MRLNGFVEAPAPAWLVFLPASAPAAPLGSSAFAPLAPGFGPAPLPPLMAFLMSAMTFVASVPLKGM